MITIPGYRIFEEIGEGRKTAVFRGYSEKDQKDVIIKISRTPDANDLDLHREYEKTKNIDIDGIVKIYRLEEHDCGAVLIIEDFGGVSLKKIIVARKLDLRDVLRIGVQLTDILGRLHGATIIHGDIKPSNIIVNLNTGDLKIADLAYSHMFKMEEPLRVGMLPGTLTYMSPEQTGRMNRIVDYRTDFYSLGVTMYEMLMGQVPFPSSDPIELIYCHIAKTPVPPFLENKAVPQIISNIIMKLLSKNPEDRYQSAYGIRHDLERCLMKFDETGKIEDFGIGMNDISEWLNIPQKIYGREPEKMVLINAFDRIGLGRSEIVLVCGHAGVGKTSLIRDVFRPVVHGKGFFIEGKYEQYRRDFPYNGIMQAFTGLIRQLLTVSKEKLSFWKEELLKAFGANGQIIIDVIPEVELIIGKQKDLPPLGATEAKNVFDTVFKNFFKVFARKEHPLVLFLDDLQYADDASLKLLETVLIEAGDQYLLFVGSYRDDEVGDAHPLSRTFDNFKKEGVLTTMVQLRHLGVNQINAMVSDMISCSLEESLELSDCIMGKTAGNPFFVIEFIKKIEREHMLRFNDAKGSWEWDIEKIRSLGFTDNVIDLLVERLNSLPDAVRAVLSLASCIGSTFSIDELSGISNKSSGEVLGPLSDSVREGFILPVRDIHVLNEDLKPDEKTLFRFHHDRIQEAAHSLMSQEDVQKVHLAIGRSLRDAGRTGDLGERIFEIVNHMSKGRSLITDEKEKLDLGKMAQVAGRKAKASSAFQQACSFYTIGIEVVPENIWEKDYDFIFSMHKERSECEYLSGNHQKAEELFEFLLSKSKSVYEQGEVYLLRLALYTNIGRFDEVLSMGIVALKLFGLDLPVSPEKLPLVIGEELKEVQKNLGGRKISDLIGMPDIKDTNEMYKMRIFIEMSSAVYFINQTVLALMALKMVNISLVYGNSNVSSFAYAVYGLLLCGRLGNYEAGYEFGILALKTNEKYGNMNLDCKINFMFACFISHWKRHMRSDIEYMEKAFWSGRTYGDFNFSSYAESTMIHYKIMLGSYHLSTILTECEENIAFLTRVKNYAWYERQMTSKHVILCLQGLTDGPESFSMDDFNEAEHLQKMLDMNFGSGFSYYYLNKMRVCYQFGKLDLALDMSEKSEKSVQFLAGSFISCDHYLYQALLMAALFPAASDDEKTNYMILLERNIKMFENWTNHSPENFECRYLLLCAEKARISGGFIDAMDLYDRAIRSAEDNAFPIIAAHGNELAAKFHLEWGSREKIAWAYLDDALRYYRHGGHYGKVKNLENTYSGLLAARHEGGRPAYEMGDVHSDSSGSSATSTITEMVDLLSIIKASQTISGEILLNQLLDKLMRILIENAGAQIGFLVIEGSSMITVEARVHEGAGIQVAVRTGNGNSATDYPQSVINYVRRTGEDVVAKDAASGVLFSSDPYISTNRPESIMCIPVTEQAKVVGILYLENRTLKNAFTPDRIQVLKLLSSQAAISIKNSLNYEEISRTKEELQQSKEQLQDSLEEYRNLFNNIQDMYYKTDSRGHFTRVSPSSLKILGYTPEEMEKIKVRDLYRFPEQRDVFFKLIDETGYIEDFETQLVRKDGSVIWISANSHYHRDHEGKIIGIEGMIRDITPRKWAEELLLDEKERLSVTLRSIGDSVIATDAAGNVVLINKMAENLTGWSQNEAFMHPLREIFPIIDEKSQEQCVDALDKVFKGEIIDLAENIILVSRNAMEKSIEVSAAPIRDKTSMIVGVVIVFRDITERKKLEAEVLKNQKLESIGIFAGGIAHDFNNILMGILGSISLAKMDVRQDQRVIVNLNEAEKASMRARELTQQLLTFSKGGSPIKKVISISDLLVQSVQFVLSGSSVKGEFLIHPDIWPVDVDENQINQVINNLVINAIQAMPHGGLIHVSAENICNTNDETMQLAKGKYVKIIFRDEGEGIPEENLSKIFDPFFTTKPKGNGLGLTTSYAIIKKHDGHIDVQSKKGGGTIFTIYLPASEKKISGDKVKKTDANYRGKGTILIMDDEEMILTIAAHMLMRLGFEVIKSFNGTQAIQRYKDEMNNGARPVAVIMDLTVPGGMGGKETIQVLRQLDPYVRAIVSSGYSNDPVMSNFKENGFIGVIVKPYRMEELKDVLKKTGVLTTEK